MCTHSQCLLPRLRAQLHAHTSAHAHTHTHARTHTHTHTHTHKCASHFSNNSSAATFRPPSSQSALRDGQYRGWVDSALQVACFDTFQTSINRVQTPWLILSSMCSLLPLLLSTTRLALYCVHNTQLTDCAVLHGATPNSTNNQNLTAAALPAQAVSCSSGWLAQHARLHQLKPEPGCCSFCFFKAVS